MKKFVIFSQKGRHAVVEVECEVVSSMEDPSVMWLPTGEYRVKIFKPDMLLEKKPDGSLAPSIYMSWALFPSEEVALAQAKIDIERGMLRQASKAHESPPTEEQIAEAKSKVESILL
jgi:hypothetical protein